MDTTAMTSKREAANKFIAELINAATNNTALPTPEEGVLGTEEDTRNAVMVVSELASNNLAGGTAIIAYLADQLAEGNVTGVNCQVLLILYTAMADMIKDHYETIMTMARSEPEEVSQ